MEKNLPPFQFKEFIASSLLLFETDESELSDNRLFFSFLSDFSYPPKYVLRPWAVYFWLKSAK